MQDYTYTPNVGKVIERQNPIAILNNMGAIIDISDAFSDISKYSREEIIGKLYKSIIAPDYATNDKLDRLYHAIEEGNEWKGEILLTAKDGIDYWVDMLLVPVCDDHSKDVACIAFHTNKTAYKSLEEEHFKIVKQLDDINYALNISTIVATTDKYGVITYVNNKFCEISQFTKEELIGKTHRLIKSGFHSKDFFQELWTTIKAGKVWKGEVKNRTKDGSTYWMNTSIVPFLDEEGVPYQYMAIRSDITDQKKAEVSLKEALKNDFQTTIKNMENCIFKYRRNDEGKFVFTLSEGKGAEKIGFVTDKIYNKEIKDFFDASITPNIQTFFTKAYEGMAVNFEMQLQGTDLLVDLSPIIHKGKVIEVVGTATDITKRKKAEQTINHMAYHDALTNLPNRLLFHKRTNEAIHNAQVNKETFAVVFLDIDRFKNINDSLGHSTGDQILVEVAKRLVNCIGNDNVVSRQGGDEFTLLIKNSNEERITSFINLIKQRFSEVFIIGHHDIYISPSIGISIFPKDGKDVETLLRNADAAMYDAKQKGENNFKFFTPRLHKQISEKVTLESKLRKALENNQFKLVYQPQMDSYTNQIIGIESLIRWEHPDIGTISPFEFIPLAEETGLIIPIGEWVLRTACIQNKKWQQTGFNFLPISVNVSLKQFNQTNFVELVSNVLQETGLAPEYLELEITESMTMDIKLAEEQLENLNILGVKVSIDDFGTGYSSLHYLSKLPISKLKIDQSFIKNLNKKNQAIVKSIIALAKNLDIDVISEGVETKEQLNFLKQQHCYKIQGYIFSQPLSTYNMTDFLHRENSELRI
ncbi:EAL domain-containing protein [Ectobacillus sp. sgz5001026]|uniref:sensor domain-containing protein n=1 Tax=Ectobacillus sp. sgz5001026 TaxID=3242473 RepID=UPI0036D2FF9A